MGSDLFK